MADVEIVAPEATSDGHSNDGSIIADIAFALTDEAKASGAAPAGSVGMSWNGKPTIATEASAGVVPSFKLDCVLFPPAATSISQVPLYVSVTEVGYAFRKLHSPIVFTKGNTVTLNVEGLEACHANILGYEKDTAILIDEEGFPIEGVYKSSFVETDDGTTLASAVKSGVEGITYVVTDICASSDKSDAQVTLLDGATVKESFRM
jgi:hypothetical protein